MQNIILTPFQSDIPITSQNVSIPDARAGHSMTVVGNPLEYIMIFGGSTFENITTDGVQQVIKKTLNDVWVFFIRSQAWN